MARRIHHFNTCRIDLSARELRRDGELVRISPRIFDCLAYLIEQRDRAVGRDELMAAVWGKVDVADTQLGQAILKARRAVGDTGEEQNTIRTVPRFGYRWIAPVTVVESDGEADDPGVVPSTMAASVATVDEENDEETVDHVQAVEADGVALAGVSAGQAPAAAPISVRAVPAVKSVAVTGAGRSGAVRAAIVAALAIMLIVVAVIAGIGVYDSRERASSATGDTRLDAAARSRQVTAILPAMIDADADWSWLRLGLMEFIASRLRDAGQATLPSDNVVAVARSGMSGPEMASAVRRALDPRWTIHPSARKTDSGWSVSLVLDDRDGTRRETEAHDADPITAARQCADQLLAVLGVPVQPTGAVGGETAGDALGLRIDAALLVDDVDSAQALLDSAPVIERESAANRLRYAQLDFAAGRLDAAKTRFDRLLDADPDDDPVLIARAASGRGATNIRLGRLASAEQDFTYALTVIGAMPRPAPIGMAYSGRAAARALLGRYDDAQLDFAQARIALQLAGDTLGLARVEMNEGAMKGFRNQPAAALASFQAAERYFERFGAYEELMHARGNQIVAYSALLRPGDAFSVAESSAMLGDRLASPSAARLWNYRRAEALVGVGRWQEASALLATLAAAIESDHESGLAAMTALTQARIALESSRHDAALALIGDHIERLTSHETAATRSELWLLRTRALFALGRTTEAIAQVEDFEAWAQSSDDAVILMRGRLARVDALVRQARYDEAQDQYEALLRDVNARGVPADIAEVVIPYGGMLLENGDLDTATSVIGQVARFAATDFGSALLQLRLYHALDRQEAWRRALTGARQLAGERPVPAALTRRLTRVSQDA